MATPALWSPAGVKATLARPQPAADDGFDLSTVTPVAPEADAGYDVSEVTEAPQVPTTAGYDISEVKPVSSKELQDSDIASYWSEHQADIQADPALRKQFLDAYRKQLQSGFKLPTAAGIKEAAGGVVSSVVGAGKTLFAEGVREALNPFSLARLAIKKNWGDSEVPLTPDEKAAETFVGEAASGVVSAAGNTANLVRSAARNVANSPTVTKLNPFKALGPLDPQQNLKKLVGDATKMTDDELEAHLQEDAAIKSTLMQAAKGEALPSWTGLDPESLAKDGVTLHPENIASWQLALDPVNLVPMARGFFAVEAAGKTLAVASGKEGAQSFLQGLARIGDASATMAGRGLTLTSKGTGVVNKFLKEEAAGLAGFGPSLTLKGVEVGTKLAGKAATAIGNGRMVNALDTVLASPTVAGSAARTVFPVVEGALHGATASVPFLAGAETPEEASGIVAGGAVFGALGGTAAGLKDVPREAALQAVRARFKQFDAVKQTSEGFGTTPALDVAHDRQIKVVDEKDANQLNHIREVVRKKGIEVYLLPKDVYDKQVGEAEAAAGRTPLSEYNTNGYVSGDRIFLNGDMTALGHEVGHAVFQLLAPEARAEFLQTLRDSYTPEQLGQFGKMYTAALKGAENPAAASNPDWVLHEVAAEVLSKVINADGLGTVKPTILRTVADLVGRGLEKLGVRTPEIREPGTSPTASALGVEPGFKAAEVASRGIKEIGLEAPTPVIEPEAIAPRRNIRVDPARQAELDKVAKGAGIEDAAIGLMSNPKYGKKEVAIFEQVNRSLARSQGDVSPLTIDYESVTPTGSSGTDARARKVEQDAAYIQEALGKLPADVRILVDKVAVPYRWQTRGKNVNLLAMSLDKVLANSDVINKRIIGRGAEGEVPYAIRPDGGFTPEASRQFVTDLEVYTRNQANGYAGDGSRVTRPADYQGIIPDENPTFRPVALPKERADYVNLVMGLAPPKTTKGSKTKPVVPNIEARRLAEANQRPVVPSRTAEPGKDVYTRNNLPIAETNPLRDRLAARGVDVTEAGLFKVTEELNLENIKKVTGRPESGFRAPSTDMVRAGFMPDVSRPQGSERVRNIADEYVRGRGITKPPFRGYATVDEPRAKLLADAYQAAPDAPNDPAVRKAYSALAAETKAQWDAIEAAGYKLEPWEQSGQPYASSADMRADVTNNKHLWYFPTEQGYGQGGAVVEHPMLAPSGVSVGGKNAPVNDLFRAVHDFFGHAKEGYEFGPRGEYNAYLAHARMFSEGAVQALAAETLGQNSWVNYGAHLRREDGSLPVKGDADYIPVTERPYAEQKAALLPPKLVAEATSFMPTMAEYEAKRAARKAEPARQEERDAIKPEPGTPQLVRRPPLPDSVGDKDLRLLHYSGHGGNLDVLDPRKFGTAAATATDRRGLPKTYYFVEGSGTGADANLTVRPSYGVRAHGGGIYDLTKNSDPLNWLGEVNREKADQKLRDAGYTGLRVKSSGRDVVALFEKTAPTALGISPKPLKKATVPKDAASFSPKAGSEERPAFYSRLNRTVEESQQGKATGAQWKSLIQNSKLGTSKGEYDLVGVGDLEDGKVYTKPEVLEYLKANQIVVKDVTLGGIPEVSVEVKKTDDGFELYDNHNVSSGIQFTRSENRRGEEYFSTDDHRLPSQIYDTPEDAASDYKRWARGYLKDSSKTPFSEYQLPGGKEGSYREVLLTVPGQKSTEPTSWDLFRKSNGEYVTNYTSRERADKAAADFGEYRVEPNYERGWKDGHSPYDDVKNPVVRLRYNERTTLDGEKMLFLEEVQAPRPEQFEKMPKLFQDKWRDIGLKWALRKAVEIGADRLGWTTGEQQAGRYQLIKHVDQLEYSPRYERLFARKEGGSVFNDRVPREKLPSVVGEETAKKLLEAKLNDYGDHELKGEDLKVGGAGLKKLYDADFHNVVNGLPAVKKSGQKVGSSKVPDAEAFTTESYSNFQRRLGLSDTEARTRYMAERLSGTGLPEATLDVHSLSITPAIRESVMAGQASFSPKTGSGRAVEELGYAFKDESIPSTGMFTLRVLDNKERPIGYISANQTSPDSAMIGLVSVDEAHQRKGIGEALYRELGTRLNAAGVTELKGTIVGGENVVRLREKVFGPSFDIQRRRANAIDTVSVIPSDASFQPRQAGKEGHQEALDRVARSIFSRGYNELFPGQREDVKAQLDKQTGVKRQGSSDKQTGSPEFKTWFGDWTDPKANTSRGPRTSQVTGDDGAPLRVFHATTKDFESFEAGRPTKNSYGFLGDDETTRAAMFFTDSPSQAEGYVSDEKGRFEPGSRTVPAYLDMRSPVVFDSGLDKYALGEEAGVNPRWVANTRLDWELFDGEDGKRFVEGLKKAGYDGAIFEEDTIHPGNKQGKTYAVFNPGQVKSATGNRGTFSPEDSRISFSPKARAKAGFDDLDETPAQQAAKRSKMVKSNFPEAIPLEFRKDDSGQPKLDAKGNLVPIKVSYDFENTPLYKEAAKGLRGDAREEAAADAFADKIVQLHKEESHRPEIKAAETWYSDVRDRLHPLLGDDTLLFTQLLAATSAQTPVAENFKYTVEAFNKFKAGDYDAQLAKFKEGLDRIAARDPELLAEYAADSKGKVSIDDTDLADTPVPRLRNWWVKKHSLVPMKENGKNFGQNGRQVLNVLAGIWADTVGGPKTPNFAGNLAGTTFEATIDIWATRFLHRIASQDSGKPWRLTPDHENGTPDKDFAFGQSAYRKAAERIGIKPDSLQALMWFLEKDHWEKNGWTRSGRGAEKSDYKSFLDRTKMTEAGQLQTSKPEVDITPKARVSSAYGKK